MAESTLMNAETQASLDFVTIEPPLPPGTDWAFWGQIAGWSLTAVLLVLVIVWLLWRFYQPWRRQLVQVHKALEQRVAKQPQAEVPKELVWRLYTAVQPLQDKASLSADESEQACSDHAPFWQALNHAAFSADKVSRETFEALLVQARSVAKAENRGLGGVKWTR